MDLQRGAYQVCSTKGDEGEHLQTEQRSSGAPARLNKLEEGQGLALNVTVTLEAK